MWATTKYVSVTAQSTGNAARKIPVSPPTVNTATNPSANSIGVSKLRLPRHVVASQLKIFTPVGTATASELIMKKDCSQTGIPTANMWWAQTSIEKKPMPTVENATAL